jgi:Protein of unknown function (DUF3540)
MLTETKTYLGQATVLRIESERVLLALPYGDAWARSALAYPYHPALGDVVLVVGDEDAAYIIGVLSGTGRTVLVVEGDLELRSSGRMKLTSEECVEIESPHILVKADKLETFARTVFERAVSSYRWVKEVLQLQAGRTRTLVDGHATLQAERITQQAEKDVKIDGRQVYLG